MKHQNHPRNLPHKLKDYLTKLNINPDNYKLVAKTNHEIVLVSKYSTSFKVVPLGGNYVSNVG